MACATIHLAIIKKYLEDKDFALAYFYGKDINDEYKLTKNTKMAKKKMKF